MKRIATVVLLLGLVAGLYVAGRARLRRDRGSGAVPTVSGRADWSADRPATGSVVSRSERTGVRLPGAESPPTQPQAEVAAIPREHVLTFYSEGDRAAFARLARERGALVLGTMRLGNALRLRVRDAAQLRELLRDGPAATGHEQNLRVRRPEPPPGDPLTSPGNYVPFGGDVARWFGLAEIGADWGQGVTVAVIDTGVEPHESMAGRVDSIDMLGRDSSASTHGTAVASLVAGNADGVQGLAPACSILGIRVLDDDGSGDAFTLAAGVVEAVDRGAGVINISLGSDGDSAILRQAINYAVDNDVVVVASAGNEGVERVLYPARYPGVIAVSAVDATARHLYFANRGDQIDLAAPGLALPAAAPEGEVHPFSGTSAAAPIVSGAVAMLRSLSPELTASEVASVLTTYADDTGAPGEDSAVGAGVLSPARVLYRNADGVYDAAAGQPWVEVEEAEGNLRIALYAQNRGTEALPSVTISAQVNGLPYEAEFRDVDVGETVSYDVHIPTNSIPPGGAPVEYEVKTPFVTDANPASNVRRFTLRAPVRKTGP